MPGDAAAAPPQQPGGRPCLYLAAYMGALGAIGVLGLVLLVQFLQNRPVNLRAQTDFLAQETLRVFERHFVPRENVRSGETQNLEDGKTRWTFRVVHVNVPESVDPAGLATLLRKDLAEYQATVTPASASDSVFNCAVGQYAFAEVRLEGEAVAAQRRIDLRPGGERVLREAAAALEEARIFKEDRTADDPIDLHDDAARWLLHRWTFTMPFGLTAGELGGRIADRLSARDVDVRTSTEGDGTAIVSISFAGKPCLDLVACPPSPESFVPDEAPAAEPSAAPDIAPAVPPEEHVSLEYQTEGEQPILPPVTQAIPGVPPKVAIILDDGGYGGEATERILTRLDTGLTLAILPNTPHCSEIARRGHEKGFEIMLHMPMQSMSPRETHPGMIKVTMNDKEIHDLTIDALKQMPEVRGLNNHMGSKFTSNADRMKPVMEVVRDLNLFFVDSVTLGSSKAYQVAQEMHVRSARRDVFLDNKNEAGHIRREFDRMIATAKKHGQCVAIGHFRPKTVEVLADELPRLEKLGIQLVHVSELTR